MFISHVLFTLIYRRRSLYSFLLTLIFIICTQSNQSYEIFQIQLWCFKHLRFLNISARGTKLETHLRGWPSNCIIQLLFVVEYKHMIDRNVKTIVKTIYTKIPVYNNIFWNISVISKCNWNILPNCVTESSQKSLLTYQVYGNPQTEICTSMCLVA